MPTLAAAGQTFYFRERPGHTPVVILHGWTETGDDHAPLADFLAAQGYRVLLPDLPGYGLSTPPHRTYPPDFYQRDAALIAAFLDHRGEPPVHLLGFSDGGEVALLLAITRPDLCRSVTTWGAVGAFGPDACQHVRHGLPATWITDDIRRKHPAQDVDSWPPQWVEAFCAMIANGGDLSLSRAHHIDCPLLLMLGENDTLNPVAAGERFIQQADRGGGLRQFKVFEDTGHTIHEQQPEAFRTALLTFLRAVDGGRPNA
jgi:valacyclovir hydrolase